MHMRRTATRFLFLALVFSGLAFAPAVSAADTPASRPPSLATFTDKTAGQDTPSHSLITSGKVTGRKIDRATDRMSKVLGGWVADRVYLDITWLKIIYCLMLFGLVVLLERIVRYILGKQLHRKFAARMRMDTLASLIDAQRGPLSLFILVYGALWSFSPILSAFKAAGDLKIVPVVAGKAADVAGYFAILWYLFRLAFFFENYLKERVERSDKGLGDMLVPFIGKTLRFLIVLVGFAVIIHRLTGLNFGPMIASLGIGGAAIAFAAKESIANFLGSLTIIFDKPFTVGDRIVFDSYDGTVEQVGFRSTRIRTLEGHLVSIPNEKIITSAMENIGQRPYIRWFTNLTIACDTPADKVEQAVRIIRGILENHEGMHPDFPPQVYFNGFNDWSLNIMVIAWYHPPLNYWKYQEWLQQTCLKIMKAFEADGIEFAFPTQTLYVAGDRKRELELRMIRGDQ